MINERIPLWENEVPLFDEAIGQPHPTLKPYLTGEKGRGAVIVCPGGGYRMKAAHEGEPIAQAINKCGVNAFVLDYRVAPYRGEAILGDAKRAIRVVRYYAREWGIDANHIGILGFSAGGHLCAAAATHYDAGDPGSPDPIERVSSRPDAFLPCYGVISFHKYPHLGSVQNFTGKERLTPTEGRRLSAEYNITEDTPPAFIWHTAADEAVPVENSLCLARALSDKGIAYSLHIFPYGRHGVGLGEEIELARDWPELMNKWLCAFGF